MLFEGPYSCGTPLSYGHRLLEMIPPIAGETCRLVHRLTAPSDRVYVRVNTLKVSVGDYLDLLERHGYRFNVDEEIQEALWVHVEGPFKVELLEKRVVADKRAAENVMLGSDLYLPGVLKAGGAVRGDRVTVMAPSGVPVANGVMMVDAKSAIRARAAGGGVPRGVAVRVTEPMYRAVKVGDLPGVGEGYIYGQSVSSMYVARLLDPRPGEMIIDLTAAPGGKVSHVAQLAGPRSRIVAVDRASKIGNLKETLTRLGMEWVEVMTGDSRYLPEDHPGLEGKFDKVILDPPCTNLGVIPKVSDSKTHRDALNLASYQYQLAKAAVRLLRRGGVLAYSVCTLTYIEGEAQAARIAETFGMEPAEPPFEPRRPIRTGLGYLLSPLIHGVTGFYISLLKKT